MLVHTQNDCWLQIKTVSKTCQSDLLATFVQTNCVSISCEVLLTACLLRKKLAHLQFKWPSHNYSTYTDMTGTFSSLESVLKTLFHLSASSRFGMIFFSLCCPSF